MSRNYPWLSVNTKDDLNHVGLTGDISYVTSSKSWLWQMKPVLSGDSYGYVSAWPQDSSAATVSPFFSVFPTALIVQALWKQRQEKGQNGICK